MLEVEQAEERSQHAADNQCRQYGIARQQAFTKQVSQQHGHHQHRLLLGSYADFQANLEQHTGQ